MVGLDLYGADVNVARRTLAGHLLLQLLRTGLALAQLVAAATEKQDISKDMSNSSISIRYSCKEELKIVPSTDGPVHFEEPQFAA